MPQRSPAMNVGVPFGHTWEKRNANARHWLRYIVKMVTACGLNGDRVFTTTRAKRISCAQCQRMWRLVSAKNS